MTTANHSVNNNTMCTQGDQITSEHLNETAGSACKGTEPETEGMGGGGAKPSGTDIGIDVLPTELGPGRTGRGGCGGGDSRTRRVG